jgi:hypothetical protein
MVDRAFTARDTDGPDNQQLPKVDGKSPTCAANANRKRDACFQGVV